MSSLGETSVAHLDAAIQRTQNTVVISQTLLEVLKTEKKKKGRIVEATFLRRRGCAETTTKRCKTSGIGHQKKLNGVGFTCRRRRRHGLSRRSCALCNCRTKKTYPTLPNPSLYSYTITSYRAVCSRLYAAAGSSRVLQRGQKNSLRENVATSLKSASGTVCRHLRRVHLRCLFLGGC